MVKYDQDMDWFSNWLLFSMPSHEVHIVLVVTLSQAHLFFPTRPIQLLKQPYCSRKTKWSELTPHTPINAVYSKAISSQQHRQDFFSKTTSVMRFTLLKQI